MAFLRHNDSLLNLASFLDEHHENHNTALDYLENQSVGDSAEVGMLPSPASPTSEENSAAVVIDTPEETPSKPIVSELSGNGHKTNEPVIKEPSKTSTVAEPATDLDNTTNFFSDDEYNFDPYAPMPTQGPKSRNLLECIFPMMSIGAKAENEKSTGKDPTGSQGKPPDSQVKDEGQDPASTVKQSAEKLDDGESKRESTEADKVEGTKPPTTKTLKKGEELDSNEGTQDSATSNCRKGILKKSKREEVQATAKNTSDLGNNRRTLFNAMYVSENKMKGDNGRKVEFSALARVLTIESRNNMTTRERNGTWWKRSDYNDFKKSSRFVTMAMLQPGSEVWLMTNPSWGHNDKAHSGEEKEDDNSGDKWWCRFGHSRRGLEHITSPAEGQERQRNVQMALQAVINEQERQKKQRISRDDERIRNVYVRYNSWARELCLAAGASDAEAVRSNFARGRCRDFYIVERKDKFATISTVPKFMKEKQHKPKVYVSSAQISIHPKRRDSTKSLAKKAVGFGTEEHLNMSAALSGMGAVAS